MKELIDHASVKAFYYMKNLTAMKVIMCFLIIVAILIIRKRIRRKNYSGIYLICLSICYTSILCITMLGRHMGICNSWSNVFSTYQSLINCNENANYEILFNIMLYLPLGSILSYHNNMKRVLYICLLISLVIEIAQALCGIGYFELADLVDNTIGGLIGIFIMMLFRYTKEHYIALIFTNRRSKK